MPIFRSQNDNRQFGLLIDCGFGLGHCLIEGLGFDGLTLAIEPIQCFSNLMGFARIGLAQQPRAQGRVADAPAGIDAWA